MSLRIIGGRARGRRLGAPPGGEVRPTSDRAREALFNIWGQRLEGWRILDVCAGSGAISLEALSRGAAEVVAIERDRARCRHIREEAQKAGLAEGLIVRCAEACAELRRLRSAGGAAFEAAFVDPPWKEAALRSKILALLFEPPPLCRSAVLEAPAREGGTPPAAGARLVRRARYGETALWFYRGAGEPEA